MYKEITPIEFKEKYLYSRNDLELIDVREEYEFDQIKIKWSKLIPLKTLQNHLSEINWDKEVIFICRTWSRSRYVTKVLTENWYTPINLSWGIDILRFNCEECVQEWNLDRSYFE